MNILQQLKKNKIEKNDIKKPFKDFKEKEEK